MHPGEEDSEKTRMADSGQGPETGADDSIEVTASLDMPMGHVWCFSIYGGLPLILIFWLFWGIAAGLIALAGVVACIFFARFLASRISSTMGYLRAHFSKEGIKFGPRKSGFLSTRPIEIAWEDIVHVRFSRMGIGNMEGPHLLIKWARKKPLPFWRRKFACVRLPFCLWHQSDFLEQLRVNVPDDRIAINPPYNIPTLLPRWACFIILFVASCAMIVSACFFYSEIEKSQLPWLIPGVIGIIVLYFVSLMGPYFGRRLPADMFRVAPFVVMFVRYPLVNGVAFLGIHPLFPAVMGAGLGVALALAIALVLRPREIRWRYMALMHALALAGFCIGWCTYSGIEGTRVGPGSIPVMTNPWTPSGDGFVTLSDVVSLDDYHGREITWYSADGAKERTITMPWDVTHPYLGDEGLILLHEDGETGESQLWYLSRRNGEPRLLDADYQGGAICGVSQNGRWALAIHYEKNETEKGSDDTRPSCYYLLDMTEGALRRIDVDFGENVRAVTPLSPHAFLVLRGLYARSKMLDVDDLPDPLPTNFKLEREGIPFTLEYWNLNQDTGPRILYEETHPWLRAYGSFNMSRIHAIRLLMDPIPHLEYITLTRQAMEINETPISKSWFKIEELTKKSWHLCQTFDGHYLWGTTDAMRRISVIDMETKREDRLRFGFQWVSSFASPGDHQILVQRSEFDFKPFQWSRIGELSCRSAVYLVDLDAVSF